MVADSTFVFTDDQCRIMRTKISLKITVDFMNIILYDLYMAEKHGYAGPVEIR